MKINNLVFLTMGTASCAAGSCLLFRSLRRMRSWSRCDGVVVDYRENEESSFFPRVRFRLPSGEERILESEYSGSLPVGSRVRVMYPANLDGKAEIESFSNLWMPPLIFLGFGLVCIFIGLYEKFNAAGSNTNDAGLFSLWVSAWGGGSPTT